MDDEELRALIVSSQNDLADLEKKIDDLQVALRHFRETYQDRLRLGHRKDIITFLLIALDVADSL